MTLRLNGSTSGYVELDAPAVAGNNNITLPSGNGSANQFLKNGSTPGTLGWSSMVEDSGGIAGVGNTNTSNLNSGAGFAFSGPSAGSFNGLSLNKNNTTWGTALYINRQSAAGIGAFAEFAYNAGTVGTITTNGSTTSYNTSSDYRLKENISLVSDGIARLQQLKPSRFNFIASPGQTVDGFIAHEVQSVVPEAITGEKDAVDDNGNPVYQGIDQSKLVPLLTAALQEAVNRIEALEAKVAALEVTP